MLNVENLSQYYGQSNILREVGFTVAAGQCTCLMGRNGVGKTTLLRCLMGLVPVASGTVAFNGANITREHPYLRARRGLGYVPQGRQIFPLLTVEENLEVPLAARRDGVGKVPARVYDLFPVLKEMRRRRGGDLSGGQQQQLAIARALVADPVLLILDEPTEGIQPNIVAEIADIVVRLTREEGMTVFQVEQKVPVARKVADQFLIMERGHIVAQGSMKDLDEETIKSFLTV
ncbi:MAG: urea ABC transporter ATP-binding subunit UrtE [Deltaproteobacteria bacterium]|jgi:urea transport system ATP-binding protein|nr:urea ABC transporter ATP-binding subunit UrtE [Deltaproteobacteria bacterium]